MIIYKATNLINGKIYIGQTIQTLDRRRKQHEGCFKNTEKTPFSRAIKKYGKENFMWEQIDSANSIEELNEKEEYWIATLGSHVDTKRGYNEKYGGMNKKHCELTKKKIGEAQVGSKNHMYGRVGADNPTSKRVINLATKEILNSATEMAEKEGLSVSKVCAVCRGERGTAGGRIFRYLDEEGNIIEPENVKGVLRRKIVNVTTGEIFDGYPEVTAWLNYKSFPNTLSTELKKGNGICFYKGYVWSYEGIDQDIIDSFVPKRKKKAHEYTSIKILNLTTGVIFDSISEAARSVDIEKSALASGLKRNNGKHKTKGNLFTYWNNDNIVPS